MLALFKETTETAPVIDVLQWLRPWWRKALDKGHVPDATEVRNAFIALFPTHDTSELEEWVKAMRGEWLMTGLAACVREIFAHTPHFIEALGETRSVLCCPLLETDWELWIETMAARLNLEFNYTHPSSSALWETTSGPWRVTLLHGSVTPGGKPKAFLRRLASTPYPLAEFGLAAEDEALICSLMENKENLLIAGATGSGKTSFLSTLTTLITSEDHLVLLEDTQEISCSHARLTRMLASNKPGRSLSDYLAYTLRLSPDRILLGEMRSHEVVPYLLAMNTGHRGLLSTLHASSASDALLRVAQLFVLASGQKDISYQEVLRLVARNVGYVVFLEKRRVKEIIRVYGVDGDQPIFDRIKGPHS